MINKVRVVSFELSNMCNYAAIHPQCPAHYVSKNRKVLSTDIIEKVIFELKNLNYKGRILMDVYNEPLIDPRLYYILDLIRKNLDPSINIHLVTNGYFLEQTILDELKNRFRVNVDVSCYNKEEFDRLSNLNSSIGGYYFFEAKLDNRIKTFYDSNNIENNNCPCHSPYIELIINCEGKIGLCCREYKRETTFGDLKTESLNSILNSEKMIQMYNDLSLGKRTLPICKKCDSSNISGEKVNEVPPNFNYRFF